MVFGVRLRTEHICLIYRQISLKSCLSIVEYRLGKYQGMHWSAGASALPYVRLYLQIQAAGSTRVEASDRILIRIKRTPRGSKTVLYIVLVLCTPICKRLFRRIRHSVLAAMAAAQTRTESGQFSRDVSREGLRKGYRGAVGREILLLLSLLTVSHVLVRSGGGDASGVVAKDVGTKC